MSRFAIVISLLIASGTVGAPVGAQVVGVCKFDIGQLSFVGSPVDQAACLLRAPKKWGKLDAQPIALPTALKDRIGQPVNIKKEALRVRLAANGLTEASVGGSLDDPLSRARDNQSAAPMARYFVIHDTSSPYFGDGQFPPDIDTDPNLNRLEGYAGPNSVAHAFNNRLGKILIGHPLSVPWRATKLEGEVGIPSKGLFIHVENVQPRRRDLEGGPKNDAIAPTPGLSNPQYRSLALLYVVASVRAGQWLIPAFHAPIDEGMSDSHDDPQNFELEDKFIPALVGLVTALQ